MRCLKCNFKNPQDSRFCSSCGTQFRFPERIPTSHTETIKTYVRELTRGSTLAGRFEVIEELGSGGMGKVYRVLDSEIKEEVALKLLRPEIADDKETIERFRNELKFSRKISHRNVCRMYDLGKEEETYYITMEYVPGEDLKTSLRRMGPLSAGKAVFIATQICEGLAEAHRLGVVHRDLKSQNIMIDKEGNAHIMDFGIARSLKAKGITESGVMIGTPDYMSPEQMVGKDTDQRSDIYSLGVILYEMVTGKLPFEGDTLFSIALKHNTETSPDPRELNPQLSEEISQLILQCMEKTRNKRYQKAEDLLSDLKKIGNNLPTTDRVLSKKQIELITPKKRSKPLAAAGILLLIGVVIVAGYFLFKGVIQKGESEKEEKPPVIAGQTTQETAAIAPQSGFIEINSAPKGAEVYLGGKREGITPFKRELPPGTHEIRITKSPEYQETTDVLNVKSGETFTKSYTLAPVPKKPVSKRTVPKAPLYTLRINTTPEAADVRIDGNYKGKTPIEIELTRNTCRLRIEKGEEWFSIDESLTLKAGINTIQRALTKIKYSLSIKTDPPEARVFINDELIGNSPAKRLNLLGVFDIKIEKDGYKTIEESIDIKSDVERIYDLVKLKVELVKIRLKVNPYADVFIDGKLIGEVPPIRIQEIEEGKHTIEFVSKALNKRFSVEVEIKAGESKEIRMNMETGKSQVVKISLIK